MKKIYVLSFLICSNIIAADFPLYKGKLVKANTANLKIYKEPYAKSEIFKYKNRSEEFVIEGCNKYGWCKLEDGGFIPDFLIKGDEIKSNFSKEFTKDKDTFFKASNIRLRIYNKPYYRAKTSNYIELEETFKVKGCDDFYWCQISEDKYVPYFLLKKLDKSELVVKEKTTIENPDKKIKKSNEKNINKEIRTEAKIVKTASEIIIDDYEKALILYKNKDYKSSYISFKKLFKDKPNDTNINFYLARSAFEIKKYQEALVTYERVLFEIPNAPRTRYELARTYFILNNYKNSKKLFLDLKKNEKLSQKVKSNIDKYLLVIEGKIKRHSFTPAIMLGMAYDSNINNASSEEFFNDISLPANTKNGTKKEADYFNEIALSLGHTYLLNDKSIVKNNLLIYSKNMFNHSNKNLIYSTLNSSLDYTYSRKNTISYGVFIDNVVLDSSNYLITYGINPKVLHTYDNNLSFIGNFKYQKKNYQQAINKERNSTNTEIGITSKYVNESNILSLSLNHNIERKNTGTLAINNNATSLKVGNIFIYNNKLSFNPLLSYKKTNYTETNSIFNRKESIQEFKIQLLNNYILNTKTFLKFGLNYQKTQSNIPSSEFDKYGINLNITRSF